MRLGIGLGLFKQAAVSVGVRLFSVYKSRVIADGGTVEADNCAINALNNGLFQRASLLLIPSGYKSGKAYAEIPTNGNGDLTWTRASDAWRTNADGLIQRVPWNLLQRSEEFANAIWFTQNATITANTTNAPNGTLTADKLIPNTSSAQHRIFQTANFLGEGVLSVYAKADGYNFLSFGQAGGVSGSSIFFNLTNGTTSGTAGGFTPTIQNVGDGWYRCSLYSSTLGTGVSASYWVIARESASTSDYVGDGTKGIFIWGAQLVEGSSAQTYFPTTDRLNVPRLSYMYGSCPALLLEPQRTNLYVQSNTFNVTWVKAGVTSSITANSGISPDGTNNAWYYSAISGVKNLRQDVSLVSGSVYTVSIWVKSYGLGNNTFRLGDGGSASTLTTITATSTWQRVTYTFTSASTGLRSIGIFQDASDNPIDVLLFGAQLELGAYATTIIPTTTASATRVADTATKTGVSSLIGQSEGTIFIDIYFTQLSNAGFRAFFSLEGNTANQFSGITPQTTNNGNDISYAGTNYTLTTGRHKIICTYSQTNNQRKLFVDGVLRATSTHTNFSATIDRYSVGCRINPFSAFDLDRQLSSDSGVLDYAMFNSLLTDAQCVSLTTL